MKPLVYIAGPYTHPDPVVNTSDALLIAASLLDAGRCTPVVPHLSMFWHLVVPRPYEEWLAYDIELLRRCDVLFRLQGASSGADAEVKFAQDNGIPVFFDRFLLDEELRKRAPR